MLITVSKFLRILRKSTPESNAFTNSGAPEVGAKWSVAVHAIADFLEEARKHEGVGYETGIANLDALVHAAPVMDLENMEGVQVIDLSDGPVDVPVKKAAAEALNGPSTVNLSELTADEVEAFVAALDKIPTAEDPHDTKE